MAILRFLRTTLIDPLLDWRLWVMQIVGCSLLMALFSWFLHLGDAFWWQLSFSAFLGLIIGCGSLLLAGGTLNYFLDRARDPGKPAEFSAALRRTIRSILPLLLLAMVFYLFESWIGKLENYQYSFPGWMRSEFPAWLRRMISEKAVDNLYGLFIGLLTWVIVPGILLPFAQLLADLGFRGFITLRPWLRTIRRFRHWLFMLLPFVFAILIFALMDMTLNPTTATLTREKFWLGTRLLLAFAIALAGWFILCAGLARGRMRADAEPTGKAAATPEPKPVPVGAATADAK